MLPGARRIPSPPLPAMRWEHPAEPLDAVRDLGEFEFGGGPIREQRRSLWRPLGGGTTIAWTPDTPDRTASAWLSGWELHDLPSCRIPVALGELHDGPVGSNRPVGYLHSPPRARRSRGSQRHRAPLLLSGGARSRTRRLNDRHGGVQRREHVCQHVPGPADRSRGAGLPDLTRDGPVGPAPPELQTDTAIDLYLPERYGHHYGLRFGRRWIVTVITVGWKLGHQRRSRLASVGEELALNALIESARVHLELHELPDAEKDWDNFSRICVRR